MTSPPPAPPGRRVDWRDDRGQFAGIEAIPFGLLIFVIGSLLVANAWAVVDAKVAVTAASREAARTYVEGPPDITAADHAARRAATDALAGHGRTPHRATVTVHNPAGTMARCTRITIEVAYPIPAVTLPFIGGYGRGFTARSHHSELIDPWRDGLTGNNCD